METLLAVLIGAVIMFMSCRVRERERLEEEKEAPPMSDPLPPTPVEGG